MARESEPDFRAWLALGAFGRRRLHGRPGDRERPGLRFGLALLLALGLGLRLGGRGLLREDRFLVLAGEQTLELVLVDRLALDQYQRELVQVVAVLLEDLRRSHVRFLDHAADLVVDLARDLL